MADNFTANAGSGGNTFASDDISSVHYPRSKIVHGANGTNDGDVSKANPLPVGYNTAKDGTGTLYSALVDTDGHLQIDVLSCASHAVTNAGTFAVQVDGNALTALQLIDDVVYVDDADWTNDTSKHMLVGGLYQSSPQTITDGDVGPFQVTTNGYLIVSVNGTVTVGSHAVTNAGTFAVQVDGNALTALQLIDDVVYVDDADWTDGTSKHALVGGLYQSSPQTITDGDVGPIQLTANGYQIVSVNGTVTVASHAVTNAGTFVVQENGAALTALEKIDNPILVDDAAFTPGSSSVTMAGFEADEGSTDSVDEGDAGAARMTLDRKQIVVAQTHTAGGTTQLSALSTAAVYAVEVKGSAGQVYGVHVYNNGADEVFLRLYNQTGAPATTDTANIVYRAIVPGNAAGAGFIFNVPTGMAFGTGIGIRVTGAVADNDGTALTANQVLINVLYK